jgi:HK97 family phage prohead protease
VSEILMRSGDGVLTRSGGVLENVDFKERIIDLIAVPWGQEARVFWRGDFWTEVFRRGAFDRLASTAFNRIRVNREHRKGDTVGKLEAVDPSHEKGLFARIKIVKGTKGDETLYLADEDMISASIGYLANKIGEVDSDVVLDKNTKTRQVMRAHLDHIAMVEDPAFDGARVLAVRGSELPSPESEPLPQTPLLDEMMRDPIIASIVKQARRS